MTSAPDRPGPERTTRTALEPTGADGRNLSPILGDEGESAEGRIAAATAGPLRFSLGT